MFTILFRATTVNMKYLNVAEKNDAAKTISNYLSKGTAKRREGLSVFNKIYEFEANVFGSKASMIMTSVSGHLLVHEFVSSFQGWHKCNPVQLFNAPIIKTCPSNFEKIKQTLEKEIKFCQGLIIWTDCDREGENIGFEIIDVCRTIKPNISIYRAKFSEITPAGVKRALNTLVQPDELQSKAVDVRSELDLRIGYAFTRFQTLRLQNIFPTKIDGPVSYGSCQFPTLGFVVQRYKEAEIFIEQKFWKIKITHSLNGLTVDFNWSRNRLFDKQCCESILLVCRNNPIAYVTNISQKTKSKWRPLPMDTIELEKLASRKFKINAKQTMIIAEKLYQQGFISYPRTETNIFSKEINLHSLVELQTSHFEWGSFAKRVLEWGPCPRNGKKSDQAHPPIHPTKFTTNLIGNEKCIFELIVRHFLACVSKDAIGSETLVTINVANEEFSASGLCIFERNYLDVYPYDKWNSKEIHAYEMGTHFNPSDISMLESSTTAPQMLTEADLISLMEKHGIGTDATHSEHINTIKERGYIGEVEHGFLVPGVLGMGLIEGYETMNMKISLAQPKLRAELEEDLKAICRGNKDPRQVLTDQVKKYKEIYKIITDKAIALDQSLALRFNEEPREASNNQTQQLIKEILKCPKCEVNSLTLKTKKDNSGFFIGCLGFPVCKNVIWLPDMVKEVQVSDEICNSCGADGNKKLLFKFKQANALILLNATGNVYTSCLACDSVLRDLLDIALNSVKKTNNITSEQQMPQSILVNGCRTVINTTEGRFERTNLNQFNGSESQIDGNNSHNRLISNNRASSINIRDNNFNSRNRKENNGIMLCPICRETAARFTVRKDGPNRGRSFFACNPCKYFKWDVEKPHLDSDDTTSINAESSTRSPIKRKCSLCRQEGHTKQKCPRRIN